MAAGESVSETSDRAAGKPSSGIPRSVKIMMATAALLAVLAGGFALAKSRRVDIPVIADVPAFVMKDQRDRTVTLESLRGQPTIVDFFFTSCTTSCPKLTARMKKVQDELAAKNLAVRLVSITVDPENDTPEKLAAYAGKVGANADRWWFLNGPIADLDRVIVKGFKMQYENVKPIDPNATVMTIMHGDWFVLVDGKGRIRGYYDTDEPEKVELLLKHAEHLARYPHS